MKKTVMIAMMVMATFLSVSNGLAEDPMSFKALFGYALRNNPGPRPDFNTWVITNENSFHNEFIAGEGATLKPDFEKQLVVAIHAETHNYVYQATILRTELVNDELHVYFTVRKARVDEQSGLVTVAALAKTPGLKKVHFYHDKLRIRTIPIVSVY